jgi:sporulation protein YlmC with PRC-barrel domain
MQIELGAHVQSRDGQEVGHISKMIVDRERLAVTAIVLRQGGLLAKETQVPLSELQVNQLGEVSMTYTADVVHDMIAASSAGGGAGADSAASVERTAMIAQYEMTHTAIGSGTGIKDPDGKKVGSVHRLACDVPSGRLTQLVVRRGLLGTETIDLPASLIGAIGESEIDLNVSAATVEARAALRPGLDVFTEDEVSLGSVVACHADHLEVSGFDGRNPLFVPLTSVARVEADRVRLAVDSGRAALWRSLPADEMETTRSTAEPVPPPVTPRGEPNDSPSSHA